jgi:phospholipase/carboxylesterase
MKIHRVRFVLLFVLACTSIAAGCNRDKPAEPTPSAATSATSVTVSTTQPASLRYIERMTGGATTADQVPLVLAIHGYGDRPESFSRSFDGLPFRARLIFPYGLSKTTDGYYWFPLSGFDPQALAEGSKHAAQALVALLADLQKSRPIQGKPIVTGFSQGGMLSFTLAVLHPDQIGEALPVAGLLAPPLYPASGAQFKTKPRVTAFHGDADDMVFIGGGRDSVKVLSNVGFSATLTEYPNVRHYVSPDMRRDWMTALETAVKRAATP